MSMHFLDCLVFCLLSQNEYVSIDYENVCISTNHLIIVCPSANVILGSCFELILIVNADKKPREWMVLECAYTHTHTGNGVRMLYAVCLSI